MLRSKQCHAFPPGQTVNPASFKETPLLGEIDVAAPPGILARQFPVKVHAVPIGIHESGQCFFPDDDRLARNMYIIIRKMSLQPLLEQTPDIWLNNRDSRLKATMMLPGYKYDYFWTDRGGFEFLRFLYDDTYNPSVELSDKNVPWMVCPTGAYPVKHLYGDNADHINGVGYSSARMANSLSTPLLRLSDVMLVLAEAKVILSNPTSPLTASTTDAEALQAINNVRQRAGLVALTSVSFEDIWKERRLELAFEGDRWYDYVRVSYYNSDFCVNDLKAQTRIAIGNGTLNDIYENYYRTGDWVVSDATKQAFEESKKREAAPMVEQLLVDDSDTGKKYFAIPMTERDVVFNPNLAASAEAVHVDVRTTYSY